MGPVGGRRHAADMDTGRLRIASVAAATALLLVLSLFGTATADTSAGDAPVVRVRSAERYAYQLLSCTRSGGWVKADGTCIDEGSGKHSVLRKPLRYHKRLSRTVAWPWARLMVKHNVCDHVIAGKPVLSRRFRSRGFRYPTFGENVGCGWGYGSPEEVVLMTHRAYQAEKASRGGHWLNLKNRNFRSVGIGVATRDGRTMVVYDFYGKRY
jgi:hypothetical protein